MTRTIPQTRLNEAVYRRLRGSILEGQLVPGQRLGLEALSQQFGVSRTPLRDALQQLALEGLIEILPRRGTFVARADGRTISELYQLRLMIDSFVSQLLVETLGARQLQRLRHLLQEMELCADGDRYRDYEGYLAADRAFHSALVRFTGNRRLVSLYEEVNLPLWLVRAQREAGMSEATDAQSSLAEHREILRALESRDRERVLRAIAAHIRSSCLKLDVKFSGKGLALSRNGARPASARVGSIPQHSGKKEHLS